MQLRHWLYAKAYVLAYTKYLKKAAIGLPQAPFHFDVWVGFREASLEVLRTLGAFVALLCMVCAYPVAVPFVALVALESDRRSAKRRARSLREASRGDCINWSDEADPK
jgi:hypothetical protein